MVVKNNYFWLGDETKIGFIANGELIKVVRLRKIEELPTNLTSDKILTILLAELYAKFENTGQVKNV